MIFQEQNFRRLCCAPLGGFESAKFQEALDGSSEDFVSITFDIGWKETKQIVISRAEAVQYAQWAKEETAPEREFLQYIKPQLVRWALWNRDKVCKILNSACEEGVLTKDSENIQIVWPVATPDVVPFTVIKAYLSKYS